MRSGTDVQLRIVNFHLERAVRRITAIFLGSMAAATLATPAFAQCAEVK